MKQCKEKFNKSQKDMCELKTNQEDEQGDFLLQGRKKAAIMQKLKEHNGMEVISMILLVLSLSFSLYLSL